MTVVRSAASEDAATLAALNAIVQDLHVAERPRDFTPLRPEDTAAWYRKLLGTPSAHAFIAEHDGQPIGYVLAIVRESPANPYCPARRWCEVDQLAVHPDQRRRGVARALVQKVVELAAAAGIHELEACTWAFNGGARRLFAELGFTPKLLRFERRA